MRYKGGAGSRILRHLLLHPQFEVVGALVSGPDKHGKDIGEIVGLPPVDCAAHGQFNPAAGDFDKIAGGRAST